MAKQDDFFEEDLYDDEEDTMENVYLTFGLEDREYGLEVKNVIEITGIKSITEVPDMPYYMKGIINLRGKIIPLVDVRLRFKNPEKEYNERTCVIMVNLDNMLVGLIVDAVSEVIRIADEQMEPTPTVGGNGASRFIKSIGKVEDKIKLILNLEMFLGEGDAEKMTAITEEDEKESLDNVKKDDKEKVTDGEKSKLQETELVGS